jgi:Tfp pilus assembly protein PilX
MPKLPSSRNGVVLYMVLVSILAAMVIASSILSIILSQARLSLHETNRVQAYYAALAGANYAIEKLRTGNWTYNTSSDNSCPVNVNDCNAGGCPLKDTAFPNTINQTVRIVFLPKGTQCTLPGPPPSKRVCPSDISTDFCIESTATYTYTAP